MIYEAMFGVLTDFGRAFTTFQNHPVTLRTSGKVHWECSHKKCDFIKDFLGCQFHFYYQTIRHHRHSLSFRELELSPYAMFADAHQYAGDKHSERNVNKSSSSIIWNYSQSLWDKLKAWTSRAKRKRPTNSNWWKRSLRWAQIQLMSSPHNFVPGLVQEKVVCARSVRKIILNFPLLDARTETNSLLLRRSPEE